MGVLSKKAEGIYKSYKIPPKKHHLEKGVDYTLQGELTGFNYLPTPPVPAPQDGKVQFMAGDLVHRDIKGKVAPVGVGFVDYHMNKLKDGIIWASAAGNATKLTQRAKEGSPITVFMGWKSLKTSMAFNKSFHAALAGRSIKRLPTRSREKRSGRRPRRFTTRD